MSSNQAPLLNYVISLDEVEQGNLDTVADAAAHIMRLIESGEDFEPVGFSIHGYEQDSRELFQIPAVRSWARDLDQRLCFVPAISNIDTIQWLVPCLVESTIRDSLMGHVAIEMDTESLRLHANRFADAARGWFRDTSPNAERANTLTIGALIRFEEARLFSGTPKEDASIDSLFAELAMLKDGRDWEERLATSRRIAAFGRIAVRKLVDSLMNTSLPVEVRKASAFALGEVGDLRAVSALHETALGYWYSFELREKVRASQSLSHDEHLGLALSAKEALESLGYVLNVE